MSESNDNLITLKNGAVYDRSVGKIAHGAQISTAHASAMATTRWEAYRQAAAEGAMKATRRDTPVKAWGYIVERQAELAVDIDKGRSSTEAARFVRDGLGLTPQADQQQPAIRIEISGEVLASLAGLVGGMVAGEIIDTEYSEAETE